LGLKEEVEERKRRGRRRSEEEEKEVLEVEGNGRTLRLRDYPPLHQGYLSYDE